MSIKQNFSSLFLQTHTQDHSKLYMQTLKKEDSRRISLPDFKTYYAGTGIMIVWHDARTDISIKGTQERTPHQSYTSAAILFLVKVQKQLIEEEDCAISTAQTTQ